MRINQTFCGRRFKSMLLTASLSVCAEFINIFIDKIVAARMLGENALAAISFFTPLFSVILFASSIVMVGSLVCYSIELGRMNKNKADRFFGQSIILSVGIGILMVVAFAIGKHFLFSYMNVEPEQMQFVNEFYGWFLGLAFLIPLNNTLQEMVYVDGDTKTCNASYVALLLGTPSFRSFSAPSFSARTLQESIIRYGSFGISTCAISPRSSVLAWPKPANFCSSPFLQAS